MKGSPGFDPRDYEYGAATESVRAILGAWLSIDWFEPTRTSDEHVVAVFREHHRLARAHSPDLLPAALDVRATAGRQDQFSAWCARVRGHPAWDWKFSVLKPLSREHATARGWSFEAEARHLPIGESRPGDLFFRFPDGNGNEHVMWSSLGSRLEALDAFPQGGFRESAGFYLGYAHADLLDCVKWQLAEPEAKLAGNPFLPLLRCYQAGAYPFSLDRETVVLFRFSDDAG